ncbi:MAG: SIR2 family protein [Prevotella sp.]|jgi:hypothetical protein|nr:SIR2 family protein [Prevotella sp.]
MPEQILTEEILIDKLHDFFREKPFILFGTGMSCALDNRFGMNALKNELMSELPRYKLTTEQQKEWQSVVSSLGARKDLENALNAVTEHELLKIITTVTARFIVKLDKNYAYEIADNKRQWPAINLLKRIYDTLSENNSVLHILTPNYDMLFEYTCDYAGLVYTDGFWGGVEKHRDWKSIEQAMREPQRISYGTKLKTIHKTKRHIRLYKVHGSLNYFFHHHHVIRNDTWIWEPPEYVERIMITPGLSKYQRLQEYRKELLQSADSAIERESRFLFIGYGFNDIHLETYIKHKLIEQSCHGLIVTRDFNTRMDSLLSEADNLWLVCKTENDSGTRIYNKHYPDYFLLKGKNIWDIKEFEAYIFGG